jgi:hypothetical protein
MYAIKKLKSDENEAEKDEEESERGERRGWRRGRKTYTSCTRARMHRMRRTQFTHA